MQVFDLVRTAKESVMQVLGFVRIVKNMKLTVSETEGVLDGTWAVVCLCKEIIGVVETTPDLMYVNT